MGDEAVVTKFIASIFHAPEVWLPLVTEDFQMTGGPAPVSSKELQELCKQVTASFPDMTFGQFKRKVYEIGRILEKEANKIKVEARPNGHFVGKPFALSPQTLAVDPTGKCHGFEEVHTYEMKDGKISKLIMDPKGGPPRLYTEAGGKLN